MPGYPETQTVQYSVFASQLRQGYQRVRKKVAKGGPDLVKAINEFEAVLSQQQDTPLPAASLSTEAPQLHSLGPSSEATALLNLARMHRAAGNRPGEAECYRKAGILYLDLEVKRFEGGSVTMDQDLCRGALACNFAVSVLQRLDGNDGIIQAYCLSMHVAATLERLDCIDAAASYYATASTLIASDAEGRQVAAALLERGDVNSTPPLTPPPPPLTSPDISPQSPPREPQRGDGSNEQSLKNPKKIDTPLILQTSADISHIRCLFRVWDVQAALDNAGGVVSAYISLSPVSQKEEGKEDEEEDEFFCAAVPKGFYGEGGQAVPSSVRDVMVSVVLARLALRDIAGAEVWLAAIDRLAPSASSHAGTLGRLVHLISTAPGARCLTLPQQPPFTDPLHVYLYHKLLTSMKFSLTGSGD